MLNNQNYDNIPVSSNTAIYVKKMVYYLEPGRYLFHISLNFEKISTRYISFDTTKSGRIGEMNSYQENRSAILFSNENDFLVRTFPLDSHLTFVCKRNFVWILPMSSHKAFKFSWLHWPSLLIISTASFKTVSNETEILFVNMHICEEYSDCCYNCCLMSSRRPMYDSL